MAKLSVCLNQRVSFLRACGLIFFSAGLTKGHDTRYFGDWSARRNSELTAMLERWEEYRRRTAPQGSPRTCRSATVAFGLIRADFDRKPRFIMLKNTTWDPGGAWWFVGGHQEDEDD